MKKIEDYKLNFPNPNSIREKVYKLDGEWEFEFDYEELGEIEKWYTKKEFSRKILVPYSYTSPISGIDYEKYCPVVWYRKKIKVNLEKTEIMKMYFEAVDYNAKVWINGEMVKEHTGGFFPFEILLNNLRKEIEIVIRVEDCDYSSQILGKQSWKDQNFLCWYTRTVGIWKSIWYEVIEQEHIEKFKLTPDVDRSEIVIEAFSSEKNKNLELEYEINYKEECLRKGSVNFLNGKADVTVNIASDISHFKVMYWTPEEPHLYDVVLKLKKNGKIVDKIDSYFGMRKIEAKKGKILLNKQELYQKLILDQGYYSNGLMTPRDLSDIKEDLKKVKEMGFNGVRVHQKLADLKYLYLCDKIGVLVWAEMPSFYNFCDNAISELLNNFISFIDKHYNHPSVITYTLFNESWGVNEIHSDKKQQALVDSIYHLTHSLDGTRLVIGNDGWEQTKTDIVTIHDYNTDIEKLKKIYQSSEEIINGCPSSTIRKFIFSKGYEYSHQPIILSEFGGIAYSEEKLEDSWGYGKRSESKEEAEDKILSILETVMEIDYLSGFCYTQLTDVEQEINGLLDKEHNYKFDPLKIRRVLDKKSKGFLFE